MLAFLSENKVLTDLKINGDGGKLRRLFDILAAHCPTLRVLDLMQVNCLEEEGMSSIAR